MLKAAAGAGLVFFLVAARPACAGTLVTGAIRDRAGGAISGARVTAFDAAGHVVGADASIADGTFAIDARSAPAQVAVSCDYCRTVRRGVEPGEPVVVIVDRFAAVTNDPPSADDIRALPYRSAADVASLRPFTVVDSNRISDRDLDYEGAVPIDGLPFYNAANGNDFNGLIPAQALAALAVTSPLLAPVYGGYADAGIYNLRLNDPDVSTSRFDGGDAADAVARVETPAWGGVLAASDDDADDRALASAQGVLPLAGGRLSLDAVALSGTSPGVSGAGAAYATDSRRFSTSASLSAMEGDDASLVTASAQVRNRGPLGLEFGARAAHATSAVTGEQGSQFDAALYVRAERRTAVSSVSAIVAYDRGGNAGLPGASSSAALVGSLADDLRLGRYWSMHLGTVSNLRIPTFAQVADAAPAVIGGDRSLLFEESLTYTDLRRLRVAEMTYTQRSTGASTGHVNGVGIDAAWQIAPALSLRSWLLRANQSSTPIVGSSTSPDEYSPVYEPATTAGPITRQLVWLSYDGFVRVDALVRGGPLEGDVRIPVGGGYAVAVGTAQYNRRRVTTLGLSRL